MSSYVIIELSRKASLHTTYLASHDIVGFIFIQTLKGNIMSIRFAFVASTATPIADRQQLPRIVRKTLSLRRPAKPKPQTHDGVDSYMRTELRIDTYHTQNLEFLDRPFDFDEFNDIDDEFDGLTIHEPMSEAELFEFCTGYNIL